jgi:predicted SAM-dependent methyltransferase
MVWNPKAPQGREAAKVRFDVLPYTCGSVLDIGSGNCKVWPHAFGVDSMLDQQLFGIEFKPDLVVPDAAQLGIFSDDSWDTVFSSHTLEHIVGWRAALREWWRLVRPGGYLVLYLPDRELYPHIGEPGANPDHKHDFAPEDIAAAMRAQAPDWDLLVNEQRAGGLEYSFLQVYRKGLAGSGQQYTCNAPRPAKTAGIVRLGGNGDALWASSVAAHLKDDGYHVTVYCARTGAEVLRHDPHVDRIIQMRDHMLTDDELLRYYAHEAVKFDRWINLVGSVESNLLPHPNEVRFFLPQRLRHRLMNRNYLDVVHEWAELDGAEPRQKFYPSAEELRLARELRAGLDGPLVVLNPTGSGIVKTWPHSQRLMELLAARGVHTVLLGDLRGVEAEDVEPYGHVVGMEWPLRIALTYATLADAVVATESVIANAVAFEPMLKVVTLSHSSNENLTRDWVNTAAIEPHAIACHPCHRVHGADFAFCARDQRTGAAACQAAVEQRGLLQSQPLAEAA